jgi:MerR family copper efflux transcriptional regulator
VPAKTIRYFESTGLIGAAARDANRYRGYSGADVAMRRFIGRAPRLGFAIEDLKQPMRAALAELADRCHGDDRPECPILDDLAGTPHRAA